MGKKQINYRYKLKKKWYSFWQRYTLKTQIKVALKLLQFFFVIWIIGSVLTIFSQWGCSDGFEGSPFRYEYFQYFWAVIIELVSGYDVGNIPFNLISKVLSVIVVITGLVIFAIFTGQIVSMFIHFLQRINHLPEKPDNFSFFRPIIICGINNKLPKIIEEIRKSPLSREREIVIIDEIADQLQIDNKEIYRDVWYIKGNQADRDLLENVLGEEETSAIILTPESNCNTPNADSRAIQTAMAIEAHGEKIHTVLELWDTRNIPYLFHTKINEWISIFEYGNKLVSQAVLQHGMGQVFHYLLGVDNSKRKSSRIFFTQANLVPGIEGKTFAEIRINLLNKRGNDITLIGFARHLEESIRDSGEPAYIKQLNPISSTCRSCGIENRNFDRLGRIQKWCKGCITNNQSINRNNSWYYSRDTLLNSHDKLIYLAQSPLSQSGLFEI